MIIQWYGHACFRLQGNTTDATVLIDPFDVSVGWKLPRLAADVVLVTTDSVEHNNIDAVKKEEGKSPFVIDESGEYEVRGAQIHGLPILTGEGKQKKELTRLFVIRMDEMAVLHCGKLNRQLAEDELDLIGRIDILIVPVGGADTLDGKAAAQVVEQIEPRIVIPMQYHLAGLKKVYSGPEAFLKNLSLKAPEAEEKFKIVKKDLPADEMRVVFLKPS